MVKRIEIFIKSRERFQADLCVFLALFSGQCSVLCQNFCHNDELTNPFTSCLQSCFTVLFSTTQSFTISLHIFKPTEMKMLACLIQNYSQTCIMRHRSSDQPVLSGQSSKSWICSLSITVIFTSIKWSPLLGGRNYLWVSVNDFVLSSTCIERSLKVELPE